MRAARRKGCGINSIDRGNPRKFAAYGYVGWWNALAVTLAVSKISAFTDQFGTGNHASQATDANRAAMSATGWHAMPCADYGSSGTIGYATASITVTNFTWFATIQGNAGSGYIFVHAADAGANGGYFFCAANNTTQHYRGSVSSAKTINPVNWRDGIKRSVATAYGGTHASHAVFAAGGVDQGAVTAGSLSNSPVGSHSAQLFIGCQQTTAGNFRGPFAEAIAYSTRMPDAIIRRISRGRAAFWKTAA